MPHTEIDLLLRAASDTIGVLPLAGGLPAPETFPRHALASAADRAILSMGTGPLKYAWPEGRATLRGKLAERLRARGADVEADDVVVTNGAQDALSIAIEALGPTTVQTDALSYPAALDLFAARGATITTANAAVRYAMPAIANPTGLATDDLARAELLSARWIIEDDAYAELRYDGELGRPMLAEARDRVFHIGTFSKTLVPGLRVGWLVPPRPWLRRVRETKMQRDLFACGLAQAIVERLLLVDDYDSRLAVLRTLYARRCARTVAALARLPQISFHEPQGGFSVWVETRLDLDDGAGLRLLLDEGVSVDPGGLFRAQHGAHDLLAMRLSFSAIDEDRIEDAVARIGRALDRASGSRRGARS